MKATLRYSTILKGWLFTTYDQEKKLLSEILL